MAIDNRIHIRTSINLNSLCYGVFCLCPLVSHCHIVLNNFMELVPKPLTSTPVRKLLRQIWRWAATRGVPGVGGLVPPDGEEHSQSSLVGILLQPTVQVGSGFWGGAQGYSGVTLFKFGPLRAYSPNNPFSSLGYPKDSHRTYYPSIELYLLPI